MKTERRERFEKTGKWLGRVINPRAWMGYDGIKESGVFIKEETKRIFTPPEQTIPDDFHDTLQRLGLTPEEVLKKQKTFLRLAILVLSLMLIALGYAVYQLIEGHIRSFIPSIMLAVLCSSFAFRYHFWYFQMKKQKLGCTFSEWLNFVWPGLSENKMMRKNND